jgi:hypothetical protein
MEQEKTNFISKPLFGHTRRARTLCRCHLAFALACKSSTHNAPDCPATPDSD